MKLMKDIDVVNVPDPSLRMFGQHSVPFLLFYFCDLSLSHFCALLVPLLALLTLIRSLNVVNNQSVNIDFL